jgi:peptidoglycan/LPS O-acetylase OafA/YrhL
LWTLETELIFYVLCMALFWLKLLHKPLALAFTCVLLILLYSCFFLNLLPAPKTTQWNAMPYHLAIIFWGGIARMYYDKTHTTVAVFTRNIKLANLLLALALLILLPLTVAAIGNWQETGKTKPLTLAVAYISGMAIFFIGAFIFKLRHRAFAWLGTISYSFYLLHPIVFTPAYLWARTHQNHWLAQLNMGTYLAITLVTTTLFSYLAYMMIEAPSNRFAHKLVERISY